MPSAATFRCYSKTCVIQTTFKKTKKCFFKTDYRLMQVKSIAEREHSVILSTFIIELPVVIKIFVLSIFKWKFYTGFTVY